LKPKAFFALVRIPTVFSSMSNAFAGYFIGGAREFSPALLFGIAAAGLFIMAGMALNDLADKEVDARERPGRPIPSGAVTPALAQILSLGMMAAGLALLWLANPLSAAVGALLCLAIFLYNFVLKGSALGPAAMGLCRALNLLTGVSLTWTSLPDPSVLPNGVYLALGSLWAYIALVTYLARDEVGGNSRFRSRAFLAGLGLWFAAWSAAVFAWFRAEVFMALSWLALALSLRGPVRDLAADPSPRHTGRMVGTMLRLVPLTDVLAMFANQVPPEIALLGALWIAPAYALGKRFYST
jgi:4-hydroxybenzoate polyprenyltransferase